MELGVVAQILPFAVKLDLVLAANYLLEFIYHFLHLVINVMGHSTK